MYIKEWVLILKDQIFPESIKHQTAHTINTADPKIATSGKAHTSNGIICVI